MMNCKDVEKQIVAGEGLTAEAGLHLLNCRECQLFSAAHDIALGQNAPNEELDTKVLRSYALQRRPFLWLRHVWIPAAAALLVLGSVFALHQTPEKAAEEVVHESQDYAQDRWLLSWASADSELESMEARLASFALDASSSLEDEAEL